MNRLPLVYTRVIRGWGYLALPVFCCLALAAFLQPGLAQDAPATPLAAMPLIRPELAGLECPRDDEPPPRTEGERRQREARARYGELLPLYFARVPEEPDASLLVPVEGVRVSEIADTFGAPRSGERQHEGVDLFAPQGTPVLAAADGFVYQRGDAISNRGGRTLVLVGAGGRRYYYAHLSGYAEGIAEGDYVTEGTVLGYVGTSGNAAGTPPHLHFGIYTGLCDWVAIDPLPLLVNE